MSDPRTLIGHSDPGQSWIDDDIHKAWLRRDALAQLDFFRSCLRKDGGFDVLEHDGTPIPDKPQELHTTTRVVHSYALAHAAGAQGCDALVQAGLDFLWNAHRDTKHGGYFWSVARSGGAADDKKLAYGHVFVLLAASSAKMAGFGDADRLLSDITGIINDKYWDQEVGLLRDEFNRDWTPFSDYRGYNSNMHGCEAFLAAYEATGDVSYLNKAGSILDFFVGKIAAQHQWRLPEHFSPEWQVDLTYQGNPMFRPRGTTPGHSFELARLALQYWDLAGRPDDGMQAQARHLVEAALADSWVQDGGGYVYTLDYDGTVQVADRYWWPVTEAIGVLATLLKLDGRPEDETWYRRSWQVAAELFMDHDRGGWFPEVDAAGQPVAIQFHGKPDIYHAIQADLLPLCPGLSRTMDVLKASRPLA